MTISIANLLKNQALAIVSIQNSYAFVFDNSFVESSPQAA